MKYTYYLLTEDADNTLTALKKFSQERGGYIKYFSTGKIILRVPAGISRNVREVVSGNGYIIDEQSFRRDITVMVMELKTRLKVKTKLLEDMYALFNRSKFHQTLDVEKEIGKLILEIEKIKGRLAYYRDRAELMEVTVHLNRKRRAVKKRRAYLWFGWIGKLGISGIAGPWK